MANLTLRRGDAFRVRATFTDKTAPQDPFDLTGWTVEAELTASDGCDSEIEIVLTTEPVDEINGIYTLSLTGTETESLEADATYQLQLRAIQASGEPVSAPSVAVKVRN